MVSKAVELKTLLNALARRLVGILRPTRASDHCLIRSNIG